ncbi:hypothetical protein D3C79_1061040 [compost metagenome]
MAVYEHAAGPGQPAAFGAYEGVRVIGRVKVAIQESPRAGVEAFDGFVGGITDIEDVGVHLG